MTGPDEQLVDELLVMECQDGSARAMDLLVVRWQKRLWRYALRLTGNAEAAWEVTQETWLGIVRGISRLNDPACFASWAYRITTNKARDWVTAEAARRRKSAGTAADEPSHAAESRDRETPDRLAGLLGRLADPGRTVLTLYYLEGFALGDIAAILGIPKGTVTSRRHSARRELKTLWERSE